MTTRNNIEDSSAWADDLTRELEEQRRRASDFLDAQCDRLSQLEQRLEIDLQEVNDGYAETRKDHFDLEQRQQKIQELEQHLSKQKESLAAQLQESTQQWKRLEERGATLEELAEQLSEQECSLKDAEQSMSQRRQQLGELANEQERQSDRLQQREFKLTARESDLDERWAALDEREQRLQQEEEEYSSKWENVERLFAGHKQTVDQFNEQTQQLCEDAWKQDERQVLLDAQAEQLANQSSELSKEKEQLVNQLQQLQQDRHAIENEQQELATRDANVAMRESKVTTREHEVAESDEKCARLKKQVDEQKTSLDQENKKVQQQREAIATDVAELAQQRDQLQKDESDFLTRLDELTVLKQEHEQSLRQHDLRRKELDERESLVKQQQQVLREQATTLSDQQVELDKRSEALVEKSHRIAEKLKQRSEQVSPEAQIEIKLLQDKYSHLKAQLDERDKCAGNTQCRLEEQLADLKTETDELKRENGELNAVLDRTKQDRPPVATSSSGFDWEAQKQMLMVELDSNGIGAEPTQEQFDSTLQKLLVQKNIHISELTERLRALEQESADGPEESPADDSTNNTDAPSADVERASILDADEVIRQEREAIGQLKSELTEKLRKSEVEFSVERARLTRSREELEEKTRELEATFEVTEDGTRIPKRNRWLSRLGLSKDEEE